MIQVTNMFYKIFESIDFISRFTVCDLFLYVYSFNQSEQNHTYTSPPFMTNAGKILQINLIPCFRHNDAVQQ